MSRLAIRPEAIADLESIEDHIALDDVDQALAFIERLYEAMTLLAGQPLRGRARPELGADVRVLSGARDIDAVF